MPKIRNRVGTKIKNKTIMKNLETQLQQTVKIINSGGVNPIALLDVVAPAMHEEFIEDISLNTFKDLAIEMLNNIKQKNINSKNLINGIITALDNKDLSTLLKFAETNLSTLQDVMFYDYGINPPKTVRGMKIKLKKYITE